MTCQFIASSEDEYNKKRLDDTGRKLTAALEVLKLQRGDLPGYDESIWVAAFESYGGCWRFNEIIGYLRLHLVGNQVRAEHWRTKAQRIVKSRKKIFEFAHWKLVPEAEISADATNSEIFEIVQAYVRACEAELKPWHVESEALTLLGPAIDWRSFLLGV